MIHTLPLCLLFLLFLSSSSSQCSVRTSEVGNDIFKAFQKANCQNPTIYVDKNANCTGQLVGNRQKRLKIVGTNVEIGNSLIIHDFAFASLSGLNFGQSPDRRAISITNGTVSIDGCNFVGGTRNGGGVESDSELFINHCFFRGNAASQGGGIFGTSDIWINYSTFSFNSVVDGGGVYGQRIFVNSSYFYHNQANYGGGIWGRSLVVADNTTFYLNQVTNGDGAAVWTNEIRLYSSRIHRNRARTGKGGGVFVAVTSKDSNVVILDTVICENESEGDGAGVAIISYPEILVLNLKNITSYDNNSKNNGGFLSIDAKVKLTILDSLNSSRDSAAGNGGSISFISLQPHQNTFGGILVTNCTFASCSASLGGGVFIILIRAKTTLLP
eukprot:TRINITY_DN4219_c0_g1_i2.p1 TRINITY_DN4219_c0_g1~~TRINITY_DN4219_c0_g1_i2.p1  ORF type:complete len:385 (-),score=39.54 TRINITY_DN4219_c0_g1_i2:1159-2313(-)